MRVRTKKNGRLAIDPRTVVSFDKDDILGVGDRGFSEENLKRLVALELAEEIAEAIQPEEEDSRREEADPKYKSFNRKLSLEAHAKEKYGVDLDKNLTLAGMVEQLETEIGEKENGE